MSLGSVLNYVVTYVIILLARDDNDRSKHAILRTFLVDGAVEWAFCFGTLFVASFFGPGWRLRQYLRLCLDVSWIVVLLDSLTMYFIHHPESNSTASFSTSRFW